MGSEVRGPVRDGHVPSVSTGADRAERPESRPPQVQDIPHPALLCAGYDAPALRGRALCVPRLPCPKAGRCVRSPNRPRPCAAPALDASSSHRGQVPAGQPPASPLGAPIDRTGRRAGQEPSHARHRAQHPEVLIRAGLPRATEEEVAFLVGRVRRGRAVSEGTKIPERTGAGTLPKQRCAGRRAPHAPLPAGSVVRRSPDLARSRSDALQPSARSPE